MPVPSNAFWVALQSKSLGYRSCVVKQPMASSVRAVRRSPRPRAARARSQKVASSTSEGWMESQEPREQSRPSAASTMVWTAAWSGNVFPCPEQT
jgi:hypothetical protein